MRGKGLSVVIKRLFDDLLYHLISDRCHFKVMEMKNTAQCFWEMTERFPGIRARKRALGLDLGVV